MTRYRSRVRLAGGLLAALLLVSACQADTASPRPSPSSGGSPSASPGEPAADLTISEALRAAVEPAGIRQHLDELLEIAEANDGIRAAGTAGYVESVSYVADELRAAGYAVTVDEFTFPFFIETAPAKLTANDQTFVGPHHLHALIFSASGDITAPVVAVAVSDDGQPIGSGGCDSDDWVDFPAGAIAVVGAGPCGRRQMVDHAQTADAAALIMSSPAYEPGSLRRPTLLRPDGIHIPAVYASGPAGAALRRAAAQGSSVHLSVLTLIEDRVTANVIAERGGIGAGSVADEVVMVGGHLDSVLDGPGINDNGSGTMTILEMAQQLAELEPTPRTVRFAFWSGEELGLYGSRDWVGRQSDDQLHAIVAYLNLDMLGSSNYGRFVYAPAGIADSEEITAAFGAYFDTVGLAYETLDLGGGSDHAPFDDALVPNGGLFSGASELKSDAQAELFGGEAGEPMSPCYHLACDTMDEINDAALDEMSDAAAHVLMLLLTGYPTDSD
ncbi:MAG: M20/M25/M40 family metallo-hydrolase [Chloroflexota bacterium]